MGRAGRSRGPQTVTMGPARREALAKAGASGPIRPWHNHHSWNRSEAEICPASAGRSSKPSGAPMRACLWRPPDWPSLAMFSI